MFTIENFPEEYFGYKIIDRNENVLFLEYSYSNIYWIKNKIVAVKFSGLDGRRLFIHTVEKDNAGKYKSTGCYAVENSRSVLSQFFDAVSVGEIEFDSMYCVVKGVSESGNVLDMFNTCRTGFIVEYIKEFFGGLF